MRVFDYIMKNDAVDEIHLVPINEIIDYWVPGDYVTADCSCTIGYHYNCDKVPYNIRWQFVMYNCRADERYLNILKSIKNNGFLFPVAARIGYDDQHIAFIDAHHRITAAYDLGIECVPTLVVDNSIKFFDIVQDDTNIWNGGEIYSFFKPLTTT